MINQKVIITGGQFAGKKGIYKGIEINTPKSQLHRIAIKSKKGMTIAIIKWQKFKFERDLIIESLAGLEPIASLN